MGRKSSSKAQSRSAEPPPMPPGERRATPWLAVAVIAALAAGGLIAYVRSNGGLADVDGAAQPPAAAQQQAAAAQALGEPTFAKFGPHKQANLPPLPFSPTPAARPADVVNAAYRFAAEHPEVLAYAPCYCGCERSGHRGNDDCFVTQRAANGDVVEWEPHGMT